jgi:hypothetical protein
LTGNVTKICRFLCHTLAALLPYRGYRREVYGGGSHHLERVTSSTASKTNPAAVVLLSNLHGDRRAPSTLAAGDESPMNPAKKGPKHVATVASTMLECARVV